MATGGFSNDNYEYSHSGDADTAQIHLDHGSFPVSSAPGSPAREPPASTVTEGTNLGVSKHNVSFQSLTGALFLCLLLGILLCIASYGSVAWSKEKPDGDNETKMQGLWESCTCAKDVPDEDWFRAVQAMISIGLIGYVITLGLLLFYMCSCLLCCSKTYIIIAALVTSFSTAVFLFIGQVVFASSQSQQSMAWGFIVSFASTVVAVIAGCIAGMQHYRSRGN